MKIQRNITLECYTSGHVFKTFVLVIILLQRYAQGEPHCSRFHYEKQTLEKMIRLEFEFEKLKSEMEGTQRRTLETLGDLGSLKENLLAEFNDVKEENRLDLEKRLEDIRMLKDSVSIPTIAFHARIPSTSNPGNGDKIVFTTTVHDSTQSYDNKTGVFIAPVAGTYLFNVQLCLAYSAKYIYYAIHVESHAVTNTLLYDPAQAFCNSATAIVGVEKNDKVFIKVKGTSGNALRETNEEWNSFSGVLLNKK